MEPTTKITGTERMQRVRELFEDNGFGNVELLEGWDGHELDELRDLVTEAEYEVLLDQLQDWEAEREG